METTAYHFHCPRDLGALLSLPDELDSNVLRAHFRTDSQEQALQEAKRCQLASKGLKWIDITSRSSATGFECAGWLSDAIKQANSVPYGLAGYAFTNRADYIDRLIDEVEVGNLSINTLEASMPETPFGGVKSSGYGREGGTEGLDNYLTTKNVWHSSAIS